MIIAKAMNIDRYDHWSYWFMHAGAIHAMPGYWSCLKNVDLGYEQASIMHDNVPIHVIMNIIVTPTSNIPSVFTFGQKQQTTHEAKGQHVACIYVTAQLSYLIYIEAT